MSASRFLTGSVAALLATGAVLLTSGRARATTCSADTDCQHGFTCQVTGMSACASSPCAPGQTCPPPPPCTPTEYKECEPGPCTVDTDCADGMVCDSQDVSNCTEPAPLPSCPPDQKCPVPDPVCTTTTVKQCVPRYMLPCTADADCGAGFTCVPDQECGCSGGGGFGVADAGVAKGGDLPPPPPTATAPAPVPTTSGGVPTPAPAPTTSGGVPTPAPVPTDCTCTNLPTSHCQANTVSCTSNTDCPANWTCDIATVISGGSGSCSKNADGSMTCTTDPTPPPPAPTSGTCAPPYSGYAYPGRGVYNTGTGGSGTTGGVQTGTGAPGTPPSVDPGPTGGASDTGSAGSSNGSAGSSSGSDSSGTAKNGASSSSNDSGGCQLGVGRASPTSASLLALLGLLGVARRRRAKA